MRSIVLCGELWGAMVSLLVSAVGPPPIAQLDEASAAANRILEKVRMGCRLQRPAQTNDLRTARAG
jgi:hypothetical protein